MATMLGVRIGTQLRKLAGASHPAILDAFSTYLNPYGDDKTFTDDEVVASSNGALKGVTTIKDDAGGSVSMLNEFMRPVGSDSWGDTIVYSDIITREPGCCLVGKIYSTGNYNLSSFGFCKSDLSDADDSPELGIYLAYNKYIFHSPPYYADDTTPKYIYRGVFGEIEYMMITGGFNSSGNPYTGSGTLADYSYGGFVFFRGFRQYNWVLFGIDDSNNNTSLRGFLSVEESRAEIDLTRMGIMDDVVTLPQPVDSSITTPTIMTSSREFKILFTATQLVGDNMTWNILVDDTDTPLNYVEINMDRPANQSTWTITEYIAGVPNELWTQDHYNGAAANSRFEINYINGTIYLVINGDEFAWTPQAIDASLDGNTGVMLSTVDTTPTNVGIYDMGQDGSYDSLIPVYPYASGNNPPGYGLVGESRSGWYFDVSSIGMAISIEITGAIVQLTNGSSIMTVKYRDFYRDRYITELSFSVTLDYEYSGASKTIAVISDPHWGYTYLDNDSVLKEIVNPSLIALGVTDAFICGDLVHGVDYYTELNAALAIPTNTITWNTITGNHDVLAAWKTAYSQTNTYYAVVIGNVNFILLGSEDSANRVSSSGVTFLGSELSGNQDKNNIIISHAGRYLTTRSTDIDGGHMTQIGGDYTEVETAIGSNNFVAWFCGHSHGYVGVKEADNSVFLNLG